jgi:hypothetical protein
VQAVLVSGVDQPRHRPRDGSPTRPVHQATGVLICPERIAAPQALIASRLAAWRSAEGVILPGHWTFLRTDAAAT